jgi:RNA polymerase sigma factor (sigma-70 family)
MTRITDLSAPARPSAYSGVDAIPPTHRVVSMSSTTHVQAPGDAELISAVRGGDTDAYGQLFERHVEAARRLARQLVSAGDVEDLVSEAFVKVLQVLQRGGGPDVAFRAYLLTAVRRLRVDRLRAASRLHTTDDMEMFDPGVPFRDTAVEGFESATAARAFASLPERWQLVLWHTEVEGQKPADVAPLLGMSANSVSALAYRAREGLRQAYLTEHASELDDEGCQWARAHLGAYIRDAISRRDAGKVEEHLRGCRCCAAIYLELSEVNSHLGAVLGPLVLGGAAAAYVAGSAGLAGVAVPTGVLGLVDRVRDLLAVHSQAAAVVGVTTAVAVTGGGFVVWQDQRPPAAESRPVAGTLGSVGPSAGTPLPSASGDADDRAPGQRAGSQRGTAAFAASVLVPEALGKPLETPAGAPVEPSTATVPTTVPATPGPGPVTTAPTTDPTTEPTSGPGQDQGADQGSTPLPTDLPSDLPTSVPTDVPSGLPTEAPTLTPPPVPLPTVDPVPTEVPPPADPPTTVRDLVMTVQPPVGRGASVDITAAVVGIPDGESATLVITGDPLLVQVEGAACGPWDGGRTTCTLTDATPLVVHAVSGAARTSRLTFTVTSDDGPDAAPDDNTATVAWD